MVNLPPDQPNPSNPPDSRRRDQLLSFDELLAVVLALAGIGSILWWGLSRSPRLLAETGLLQGRPEYPAAIADPREEDPAALVPRTLDPGVPLQRDWPQDLRQGSGQVPGAGPGQRRPIIIAPLPSTSVPVAPTTVPDPAPAGQATQPLDISDVPTTHWAYPFIRSMFDQGYLPDFPESGFQPDQPLTRAELAALLSQAFGNSPREGSVRTFNDVPDTYWAVAAIDNAVAQGFMNGYPDGNFRPDQAVPRYEVLVSLVTGLDLPPSPAPDQSLQAFIDSDPLPDWARPKVASATDNALVVNYPARDQLKPTQAATRAEIVAMVHQALVQRGALPAVESEYTVP
ncbi:S-layer homology domain-containing protein [Nodosilinea sp. E11]|uniref:S-layer homology domain-containing protein n=1 Tax=Nodosilinea sp. E11 TaxID=3037479 RepID=UPI0029351C2A|nr:S-layer homology domain-containing protein [Nodosilinea sp. E11]WOD40751.1 S-layer homology domain-containing protein [Nodosilinea sp. E11]